jgi:hypothetical protein
MSTAAHNVVKDGSAPDHSPPASASGYRPVAPAMGRLNRTGKEPGFYEVQDEPVRFPSSATPCDAAAGRLALTPPMDPSRPLTILHRAPKLGVRAGKSGHDRHAELPESRPHGPRRLTIPKAHSLRSSGSVQQNLSAMLPHGGLRYYSLAIFGARWAVTIILDSNIWLAELGLRSPLGAVARLYLQQKRARLALPEVVRLEIEHNLRNRLRDYVPRIDSY